MTATMGARSTRSSGLSGALCESSNSCSTSTPRLISSSTPYSRATSSARHGAGPAGLALGIFVLVDVLGDRRRSHGRGGAGGTAAGGLLLLLADLLQLLGCRQPVTSLKGSEHLGRDLAQLLDSAD